MKLFKGIGKNLGQKDRTGEFVEETEKDFPHKLVHSLFSLNFFTVPTPLHSPFSFNMFLPSFQLNDCQLLHNSFIQNSFKKIQ